MGVLEGRREELRGAVRLVAGGKAAGEHDDLGLADGLFKLLHGFPDIGSRQVAEHLCHHVRARALEGLRAVVLAVRAREDRDEYGGLRHLMPAYIDGVRMVQGTLHLFRTRNRHRREDLLQRLLPGCQGFLRIDVHIAVGKAALRHLANHRVGDGKLAHFTVRNLGHDIAEACGKEIPRIHIMLNLYAQLISKGHLADGGRQAGAVQGVRGDNASRLHILKEFSIQILDLLIIRQIVSVPADAQPHQLVSGLLKLRRQDVLLVPDIHRKGHQSRRHVDIVEGAGHTVLAADGGQAKAQLRAVGAQKSREGLAPAVGILRHAAEVLLEGEADPPVVAACRHDSGHRFNHRVHRSVVGAPAGQIGIEAIAHHSHRIRLSLQHRKLGHHGLGLGQLVLSAVGHQHAARADGAVEHLHQSLLGAHVQIL